MPARRGRGAGSLTWVREWAAARPQRVCSYPFRVDGSAGLTSGEPVDRGEAPVLLEPARHELLQVALALAAHLVVGHPPGRHGVGPVRSVLVGRVDVDAAQ